jgi:hypothetical protein
MDLQGDILTYAIQSAEIRARNMTRNFVALAPELEDIRQDLLVNVIRAKYDPARSCPKTFISRVMDKSGLKIIRKRMTRLSRIVPLRAEDNAQR